MANLNRWKHEWIDLRTDESKPILFDTELLEDFCELFFKTLDDISDQMQTDSERSQFTISLISSIIATTLITNYKPSYRYKILDDVLSYCRTAILNQEDITNAN